MADRRTARTCAFKFLYHLLLDDGADEKERIQSSPDPLMAIKYLLSDFEQILSQEDKEIRNLKLSESGREFTLELIQGVLKHESETVATIKENLKNWKYERLHRVDVAILHIAIFELVHQKQQVQIVINEAVELAKEFGTADSASFINGLLDKLAKKIESTK